MATSFALPEEPRPSDFSARIKRSSQRSVASRRRRRHRGRSALVALGAFALPAFAQPAHWERFQIGDAEASEVPVQPMPFEQAGNSFPGSAFYYLDQDANTPGLGEDIHSDADPTPSQPVRKPLTAALPMRIDDSSVDRRRAEQCLAAAVYYEAASESDAGQRAVAQVVLNRVAHPAYPDSVCGVVYQGSQRSSGCQFSFTCDGSLARKPVLLFWERAKRIARDAISGYVDKAVGLATHYHTVQVHPFWASSLAYLGTIGAHRFYRFKGAAGRRGTFSFAYNGVERLPVKHRPSAALAARDDSPDPVTIQRAFDEQGQRVSASLAGTGTESTHGPAPLYTRELTERGGDALFRADKLPDESGVKAEYRNSGQWITKPVS